VIAAAQRGFVLVTVVITISLAAAIAFALSARGVVDSRAASGDLERDQLRYTAEAGLAHARYAMSQITSCTGYPDIAATPFAGNTYSTTFSAAEGSPVSVASTATSQAGSDLTLSGTSLRVFLPFTESIVQPGPGGTDTYIRDGANSGRNFGGANILKINNASAEEAALLKFDFAGYTKHVSIQSAVLELYLEDGQGLTNGVIDAHRVTRAWVEGDKDGDPPPAGEGATYDSYDGQTNWSNDGGDYTNPPVASQTISSLTPGWHAWDLTTLVQRWASREIANHGMLLRASGGDVHKIFFTSGDGAAAQRPRLRITYQCECGYTCAPERDPIDLLFVVSNPLSLDAEERARRDLFESWAMVVALIDDSASQSELDAAVAANDVVYISEEAEHAQLGNKLRDASIGVVVEEQYLHQEFGFSNSRSQKWRSEIDIVDNSHYITAGFPLGRLSVLDWNQMTSMVINPAAGLTTLAKLESSGSAWEPSLAVIDVGGQLAGGGTAAGRRAKLPWGEIIVSTLTEDGKSLTRRAIEWAAHDVGGDPMAPIAHWKLDDGGGTTAVDSAGDNDGTLVNGPIWGAGKLDGGLSFDGNDDYIDVSVMNPVTYEDFTVSAWYKSANSGVSDDEYIFEHNDNFAYEVTFGPTDDGTDDRLRFGFANGGSGTWDPHYGTSDIVDQEWHHVVGVRDAGRIKLYVDGVEESDGADAHAGQAITIDGDGPFIGDLPGNTEQIDGALDDVRLYDRALSAAGI